MCKAYFGRINHTDHKLNALLLSTGKVPHTFNIRDIETSHPFQWQTQIATKTHQFHGV